MKTNSLKISVAWVFFFTVFYYFLSTDYKYGNDFILYALFSMQFEVLHFTAK